MKLKHVAGWIACAGMAVSMVSAQNADPNVQPGVATAPQTQPAARRGGRGAGPALARVTPTAEQLATINSKLDQLNAAIKSLKDAKADDALIAEAEVSAHFVGLTLRFPEEFFDQAAINRCISALDDGLMRAVEIKDGKPGWVNATGRVSRAFRSRIDGTPQPYRVIIPASYDKSKPTALYVYLHGRGDTDLGLGWIGGQLRPANGEVAGENRGPSYIQLQVFGRANNSFRYAGEDDVLQALETVRKNHNIDPNRIVLAGFSMGGAGAWQLGLRIPDMFAGLSINAGVIGNRRNVEGLSIVQKASLVQYGLMPAHAINITQVPLVGFAGENDAQLAASTSMREQLAAEGYSFEHPKEFMWQPAGLRALFLFNPGQGHEHPKGVTLPLINDFNAASFERGRVVPDAIKFATYTTRYNRCYWITVDGMQQHFDRAYVEATRDAGKAVFAIKTTNVSRLILTDVASAKSITIDGESIPVKPADQILLLRSGGKWQTGDSIATAGLRKQSKLQGPVNDAFLDAFICVNPSGVAFNPLVAQRSKDEFARFETMMAKEYRGAAPTRLDSELTPQDIANSNLILFGDPSSNRVIAQIADKLPIKWTRDSIAVGDKSYSTAEHLPVLIYPNPLNPSRYVVINTGLVTGGGGGGLGAGYGDYAVLKMTRSDTGVTTEIADGGVFDEQWKLAAK